MPTWDIDFRCRLDLQDPDIVASVAKVEALAQVIRGIPLPPAIQHNIDTLNILRAVRGTTGIEGTEVSQAEVAEIMRTPQSHVLPEARRRAEQEVRNAEHVMRFVASALKQRPDHRVNEGLICEIHRLTTQDIDYPSNEPGVYRSHAVHVGTYVPPRTHEEVRRLMTEFVEWLNEGPPRAWPPPVIQAAAAHFYLISIHPFGDGNGRTARGLESFLFYKGGINSRGFYSLANYYYQHRPEYVAMLDHVRFETAGDITPFIRFALMGLVAEQEAVHQEILSEVTKIAFRDFARAQLEVDGKLGTKPGTRMFHFLLGLPEGPVSAAQLRKGGHPLSPLYHGVTAKTLSRDLKYLRERELIKIEGDSIRANVEMMKEFM